MADENPDTLLALLLEVREEMGEMRRELNGMSAELRSLDAKITFLGIDDQATREDIVSLGVRVYERLDGITTDLKALFKREGSSQHERRGILRRLDDLEHKSA